MHAGSSSWRHCSRWQIWRRRGPWPTSTTTRAPWTLRSAWYAPPAPGRPQKRSCPLTTRRTRRGRNGVQLGVAHVNRSELDQAQAYLANAAKVGLAETPNMRTLWALAEIESLPEEPEAPEGDAAAPEEPQDPAVVAQRKAISTALLQGAAGAHWLLRRRAQWFLA